MASIIPAFAAAMQDPALRGHAREVYIWLHEHLDTIEYRPVKHAAIEAELSMKDSSVRAAISCIVERGYLHRGERDGQLWTYRLIYSRPAQ